MTDSHTELSPAEFKATAIEAAAACFGLEVSSSAKRLAADGLLGVLAPETVGGLGLPLRYAVPVIEAGAAGLVAFPLIETLLIARAISDTAPEVATRITSGDTVATIAWRGTARASRAGSDVTIAGTVDRAVQASRADHVLVFLDGGGAALAPTSAAGAFTTEAISLCLETPEDVVTLQSIRVEQALRIAPDRVAALKRDALVLQAAACLGSAEASLAMAVAHVSTRRQFGTALVANQAVRHTLARHKLSIEGLRSALERCFMTTGLTDLKAITAFVHGVEAGVAAAEGAIQLHGGMGFTWDVPAHRHLRHIRSLGQRGGIDSAREALAIALIDANDATDQRGLS
jgi:alkylation response protein AidB-like acyl-CoA dehydrogenase